MKAFLPLGTSVQDSYADLWPQCVGCSWFSKAQHKKTTGIHPIFLFPGSLPAVVVSLSRKWLMVTNKEPTGYCKSRLCQAGQKKKKIRKRKLEEKKKNIALPGGIENIDWSSFIHVIVPWDSLGIWYFHISVQIAAGTF